MAKIRNLKKRPEVKTFYGRQRMTLNNGKVADRLWLRVPNDDTEIFYPEILHNDERGKIFIDSNLSGVEFTFKQPFLDSLEGKFALIVETLKPQKLTDIAFKVYRGSEFADMQAYLRNQYKLLNIKGGKGLTSDHYSFNEQARVSWNILHGQGNDFYILSEKAIKSFLNSIPNKTNVNHNLDLDKVRKLLQEEIYFHLVGVAKKHLVKYKVYTLQENQLQEIRHHRFEVLTKTLTSKDFAEAMAALFPKIKNTQYYKRFLNNIETSTLTTQELNATLGKRLRGRYMSLKEPSMRADDIKLFLKNLKILEDIRHEIE